jgi:hypothetical protein
MLKLRDWVDINKINWSLLSKNPNAIELLKENQDKINWVWLSFNPNAMTLLKENPNKIDWFRLSLNPNAMSLLKENQDKISWWMFSQNPNIFTYDYIKMKEKMKNSGIVKELMSVIFHPKNMNKWFNLGFSEHQEMLEFINN